MPEKTSNIFPVMEIFESIQGEGVHMGEYVTFVRFAGCNLRCPWCDTKTSWNLHQNDALEYLDSKAILERVSTANVVLTGGEPFMHEGIYQLIQDLWSVGRYVAVETNGTYPTHVPFARMIPFWVTASPKPPMYHMDNDCKPSEFKFVVDDEFDFDRDALPLLKKYTFPGGLCVPVWLQPNGENMVASAQKAYKIIESHPNLYGLRLGIQLHKIFDLK